ncbi:MAG TPA: diacylglycerol kinase family lipid kinase [Bacteroidales bacterium]|nr:diacylglycerol kinase family lipid kinase [Bacteroidales bacterium]
MGNDNHKKKIVFILNPISGVWHTKQNELEEILENHLDKNKYESEIRVTESPTHATVISREAVQDKVDIVVSVGGDGSINQAAKGLTGSQTALGIIPSGSGNGLAHHLNIPFSLASAVDVINQGKIAQIDTVSINEELFVSIAGIGFDALVAQKFAHFRRRGFLSYFQIISQEYLMYHPQKYRLIIDDKVIACKALFISFANSNQFGYNTMIAPNAEISDGLVDVCIFKKVPLVKTPLLAHFLFRKKIDKSRYIEIIKAKEIKVVNKNKWVNIDGDPVQLNQELNIHVNPLSLNVVIP